MPRLQERKNYFVRKGRIVEARDTVGLRSVSGKFESVYEKKVRKEKGDTHWIVFELDPDEYAPTKGVYFDARDFRAMSGIIALAREGVTLKKGDDIVVRIGNDGLSKVSVNGVVYQKNKVRDEELFREQHCEYVALLDGIRGEHADVDFKDEVESYFYVKVCRLFAEHVFLLENYQLRRFVLEAFLPDMPSDSSFEDIYPALERKFPSSQIKDNQ